MRLVFLGDESLFAAGIISRLATLPARVDLKVVDMQQPDALATVIAARPEAIIVDDGQPEVLPPFALEELLRSLPVLTIVRLDHHKHQIQVVRSEQHQVMGVDELCLLIETAVSGQE